MIETRLHDRRCNGGGHRISECRSDVSEHPALLWKSGCCGIETVLFKGQMVVQGDAKSFGRVEWSTEKAGLENEGQKWNSGMNYVDRKMQDNFAGLGNAGLENARQKPENPEINHTQIVYCAFFRQIHHTLIDLCHTSQLAYPVFDGRKHNKQLTAAYNMQEKNTVNVS